MLVPRQATPVNQGSFFKEMPLECVDHGVWSGRDPTCKRKLNFKEHDDNLLNLIVLIDHAQVY